MIEQPEKIGKYLIRRTLGKGAMGVVYEGFDPDIERRVAIKTLHPHLTGGTEGQEFLARFKREAQAAAKCMHPNIVMVMEYGQDGETPFIAMEYVEGTELNALMKSGQNFSLKQVLSIISQVLKALHIAHSQGIVHRDIKPANIMVLKDGTVKLADFGIARIPTNSELTQVGAMIGTPRFMAPEQTFGQPVDHRADLFATTMIFSELLCKLPDTLQLPKEPLPRIDALPPNNKLNHATPIPSMLIPVLHKGLALRADARFQNAREYAQAIKEVLPQLKQGASLNTGESPMEAPSKAIDRDSEDMLELETLLSGYIGPIAKRLVDHQATACETVDCVAQQVAQEIPSEKDRTAFLSKWREKSRESDSLTSLGSQSQLATYTSSSTLVSEQRTMVSNLDEDTLTRLQSDYASYVGPMASRLIKRHAVNAISMAELIHGLASDIPNDREREIFVNTWSQ